MILREMGGTGMEKEGQAHAFACLGYEGNIKSVRLG